MLQVLCSNQKCLQDYDEFFLLCLFIKYVTRKFIIIRSSNEFFLHVWYLKRPTVFSWLTHYIRNFIQTSSNSGILFSISATFFSKLCLSVFYWFVSNKKDASRVSFPKLFTFLLTLLYFAFFTASLHYYIHYIVHFFKNI